MTAKTMGPLPACCLRSFMSLSNLCVLLTLVVLRTVQGQPQQHVYTDSFPTNDEYDFNIMDPLTVYGSPYGGFSRATRSRLASLPLYLPAEVLEVENKDETAAERQDDDQEEEDVYYEVSDAAGRLFVCRVYHQDELDPDSLDESMFDAPKLRIAQEDEPLVQDDKDDLESVSQEGATKSAASKAETDTTTTGNTNKETGVTIEELEKITGTSRQQVDLQRSNSDLASLTDEETGLLTANVFTLIAVERSLARLKGVCAQIHLGWWSYEWCHEDRVAQFHVEFVNSKDPLQRLQLTDLTNLGTFSLRNVRPPGTDMSDPAVDFKESDPRNKNRRKNLDWEMLRGGLNEIGIAEDVYVGGDTCPDTGKPREMQVIYRCCSNLHMARFQGRDAAKTVAGGGVPAVIADLFEKEDTCQYEATICTPLLCSGGDEAEKVTAGSGKSLEEIKKSRPLPFKRKPKKDNESIRYTLERVLENVCLQNNDGGWWTYEMCWGKHVRQFHEEKLLDRLTGLASKTVDTQHYLGFYSAEELEKFPDDEEVNHVVNATEDIVGGAAGGEKGTVGGILVKRGARPSDFGGNGAYFVQEFTKGDVCADGDVTAAAVKAGTLGKGGIERATTVRYFCGGSHHPELMRVNEDSTCHYVVDVAIPDLCEHPLFKAPVFKKQVVKCLPVNDSP